MKLNELEKRCSAVVVFLEEHRSITFAANHDNWDTFDYLVNNRTTIIKKKKKKEKKRREYKEKKLFRTQIEFEGSMIGGFA